MRRLYLRDALARRELGRDQSNAPISLMVLTLLIDVLTRRLRIILHHLLPSGEKCLTFPGSNFGELSSVDIILTRDVNFVRGSRVCFCSTSNVNVDFLTSCRYMNGLRVFR